MTLSAIEGQGAAVETLQVALASRRVHHAYLFAGPDGVGKEAAARSLAQALVCTSPRTDEGQAGLACEACDACRRAITDATTPPHVPLHPDLVILERGLYPPEAIGRSRPELTELSVDQVRTLVLARAAYPPLEGRARVYIVRRADELSNSAANALLKTLEEPGPSTHFVLLSARPDKLLPTIRSRALLVRFGPLPAKVMSGILSRHGVPADRHAEIIDLAAGSASAALDLADPEAEAARKDFIERVLAAIRAPDLGLAVSLGEARDRSREDLALELRSFGGYLARSARAHVRDDVARAERAARGHALVTDALTALEGNASPQLTLTALVASLRALR